MKRAWIAVLLAGATTFLSPVSLAVSIESLVAHAVVTDIKISPDGRHLAIRAFANGQHYLRFVDTRSMKTIAAFGLAGTSEVGDFWWVNNERVVGEIYDRPGDESQPVYYGELFATNFDGSQHEVLFGYRLRPARIGTHISGKAADNAWADVVDPLPDDKDYMIIARTPMSRGQERHRRAEMLNVYTGKGGPVLATSEFGSGRFFVDRQSRIRLIVSMKDDGSLHVQAWPDRKTGWINLPEVGYGGDFFPLAISDEGDSAIAFANAGGDKLGLYQYSLDGTEHKLIYVNEKVDVSGALLSPDGRRVIAIRIDDGYPSYLLYRSKDPVAAAVKQVIYALRGRLVDIRSSTRNLDLWTIDTSTDVDPGAFYLFDRKHARLLKLQERLPGVDPSALSPMRPISFQSFDHTPIAGYFTAAKGRKQGDGSLVVLVHGGPGARDYWGFNPEVQVLATHGYSVLQINYRGSAGYGRSFLEAGEHHWGDDIQKDIIAGTRWAIDKGYARKGNVYIIGASFGAYSAVQSALLAPELYKCVVANAGVYDLNALYISGDIEQMYWGKAFLEKNIGKDKQALADASPINHIAALRAPIFLAHGKKDNRAPFSQAVELRKALDKYHKPYKWFVEPTEGHGFYDTANRVAYLKAVLDFLANCQQVAAPPTRQR